MVIDNLLILALFSAFFAGIGLVFAFNWQVERKARSLFAQKANAAGRSKLEAQGTRLKEAMAEAMILAKDENFIKDGKPDFVKIGLTLLPKYPDVAFQMLKEFGIDGLKGLV